VKTEARRRAKETFEAVAEKFLTYQREQLRPGSYRQVERHIRQHAKPLQKLQLASIDRRTLATRISEIKDSSGAVTANRVGSTWSYLFTWAMNEGLVEHNPLIGINKFEEKPRERVLDDAELRVVWQAAGDDHYGAIVKLLVLTGQREDEIASLQWSEIKDDRIELPGARTKNGNQHAVPLSDPAIEIINKQPRPVNTDGTERQFVFGIGDRGFSGWSRCKERLDAKVADQAERPLPDWRIHDLRRSTATGMAKLGVLPGAQSLGGPFNCGGRRARQQCHHIAAAGVMAGRGDEILAEIVALLHAPEPDDLINPAEDALATEISVRGTINYLLQLHKRLARPVWGNRSENLKSLKSVSDTIAALQDALASMPDAALALLFAFEENGTAETIPTEQVQRLILARCKRLTGTLAVFRARCDNLIAEEPGKHGGAGIRQEWAALAARDLLIAHYMKPTINESGPYLAVTGLLYEAMTGEVPDDLSRACKAAIARSEKLPTTNPGLFLGRKIPRKRIFPS
jgi:integrase